MRARELRKQGRKLKLQSQPFQILAILIEQPGEIVTREELCRRLWPDDTFVDFEHSLNAAVRRLREALSDSAENPVFIETLQRRGYRFIAPVVFVDDPGTERTTLSAGARYTSGVTSTSSSERSTESSPSLPSQLDSLTRPGLPLRVIALFVLVSLLVGASLAIWIAHLVYRPNYGASGAKSEQVRSLAVLPLENLSAKPDQEYLADGMTDELIASLTKVKSLRVVPRTTSMAYKGSHKSLSEIARELNVDAVVEGTVMRSGKRVRITAELVQIAADRALWAETYESTVDNILSLLSG